ncbi:hypothetical protein AVEN_207373-1 [Araneus ventricosus]|uniref:Uncharacterized protein n=1 Tax=Araneus ventricosus TaxID=182803 RepID=A0A4Y2KE03_ARAVE|nr:hypothetical protein AVEN_207373-1 [Araneus ventricosus]
MLFSLYLQTKSIYLFLSACPTAIPCNHGGLIVSPQFWNCGSEFSFCSRSPYVSDMLMLVELMWHRNLQTYFVCGDRGQSLQIVSLVLCHEQNPIHLQLSQNKNDVRRER